MILWRGNQPSDGSTCCTFHDVKFGEGAPSSTSFRLSLGSAPPPPALIGTGGDHGIGFILLVGATSSVADGTVVDSSFYSQILGASTRLVVTYQNPATRVPSARWPNGYSCWLATPATNGPDTLAPAPASCDSVTITVDDFANLRLPVFD
jgi:hypothetical protein